MRKFFYETLSHYLSVYILPDDTAVEVNPQSDRLSRLFANFKTLNLTGADRIDNRDHAINPSALKELKNLKPDYIVLNGNIHYERDIQRFLDQLKTVCRPETRIILTYYSALWKPVFKLASTLGLRDKTPEQNWLTHGDVANLLSLADYEAVALDSKVILPVYLPLISNFANRYLAPLPVFRQLGVINILLARPQGQAFKKEPSVSIIVPARNEAGNIENIIKRVPRLGDKTELIFIEGHSTDDTWAKLQAAKSGYSGELEIKIARQEGKGKGDAVRKGFAMAEGDILMILDADLTVPPETLPLFYRAVKENKGEFINGCRLVYPMEEKAMRFLNLVGNKFFAMAFSFVLGQKIKDTLCGTKVLARENYLKIVKHRRFFGEFDPFGDFDLIFGATRLGLKLIELPINYRERTYGDTNINRFRDGLLLLRMLLYAAKKIKFV